MDDGQVLRRTDVAKRVGLSRATIYRMISRGEFPPPIQLSRRATGWRAEDIEEWLTSRKPADPRSEIKAHGAREKREGSG